MFEDTSLSLILLPIILAAVVLPFFLFKPLTHARDPGQRLSIRLRFLFWSAGAVFLALWFLLPITPVLATFGYPQSVADLTPEKTLQYLQSYNKAIVRMVEVVHWALFIGIFWIGAGIEAALREYHTTKKRLEQERGANA